MLIVFYTHIFPDSIADKSIAILEDHSDSNAKLPATVQELKDSINQFAASINRKNGIYSLGGIHPENESIAEKMEYIKSLGLKGIKLHPDYQGPYIDDKGISRLSKSASNWI